MSGKFKKIVTILAMIVIWNLCCGAGVSEMNEDGDVVGFIGDSITHVEYLPVSYVELLENYCLTHYPEKEMEFRNLGMAGCMVSDILEVYHRDPAFRGLTKAVILLGMNDAMQKVSPEKYLADLEELIGNLKADGLSGEDILVLSPTPYDQTCGINYDRNGFPYQTTDTRLSEFVAELPGKTEEWGVRYVDLHTPMRELSLEIQKENDRNTLTVGDCIHPAPEGHWMIAYEILKAQGADFSGDPAWEEGDAWTADFYAGEKGQYWLWKPPSLPIEAEEGLERLCAVFPEAEALAEEKFRAEGLEPETSYTVTIGGKELGVFQGRELAEGISLAAEAGNPWKDVTGQAAEKNRERHHNSAVYRASVCALRTEEPDFSEERLLNGSYADWKSEDIRLREEIRRLIQEAFAGEYQVTVVEEGYSPEEFREEAVRAVEEQKAEEERLAQEQAEQEARREEEMARSFQEGEDAAREKENLKKTAVQFFGAGILALLLIGAGFLFRNKIY